MHRKSLQKRDKPDKTNPNKLRGSLTEDLKGSDVFIGVSGKGHLISKDTVTFYES